jgi:CRP/FNR family cyclic AMP-dependent transcriptional regulator
MVVIDLLNDTVWARELTSDELDRARRGVSEKSFSRGSYVCHRGDKLDYWTGVVSGLVKISAISVTGKAMTFAGVGAGGWFGEGSVLKDEPRRYDLVAIGETRLAMLSRPTFMWLFENSTGFNRFPGQAAQRASRVSSSPRSSMTASSARKRGWRGIFRGCSIPCSILTRAPTSILARKSWRCWRACRARRSASRLQALESEGLLSVEHSRIVVHDLDALRDYEED